MTSTQLHHCTRSDRELDWTLSPSRLMTSTGLLRLAIQRSTIRFQPCTRTLKAVNRSPNLLPCYQHRFLLSQGVPAFVKTKPPASSDAQRGPKNDSEPVGEVAVREQRKKDWSIMRKMMEHMWPRDWGVRSRVILGLGLLVGGKVNYLLNLTAFLLIIACISSC